MEYTLTDIQCIQLPVNKDKFTEEQLQEIAMGFMFTQLAILQEFGIKGAVSPIGPMSDLLFSVEIEKPISSKEYLEHEQLFIAEDPLNEFQAGLNRYIV